MCFEIIQALFFLGTSNSLLLQPQFQNPSLHVLSSHWISNLMTIPSLYTLALGMCLQAELDLQHSIITMILLQNIFHPWQTQD